MALSLNKITLIGNVGKDPEIKTTKDNKDIASFTLATTESWKDKATGEKKERTEWHRVVIYNEGLVNVVKNYITQGTKLYVEGSLATRKWMDNAGVEKTITEIVLQNFNGNLIILNSNSGQSSDVKKEDRVFPAREEVRATFQSKTQPTNDYLNDDLDDEIPF